MRQTFSEIWKCDCDIKQELKNLMDVKTDFENSVTFYKEFEKGLSNFTTFRQELWLDNFVSRVTDL